ncbi:MAG: ATP-dependent zinc metalloprotease FtsH [Epsilonproteobacteria bacterium]|nr:ATP-dependent zinc metalloprotease FtsH [Campylobacterota bacterium]
MRRGGGFGGRGPNAVWLLLAMVCLGLAYLFWYNSINREVSHINYTTLMQHVKDGDVKMVVIQDQHVQGKFKDDKMFEAYVAPTQKFWNLLEDRGVNIEVVPLEKQSYGHYFLFSIFMLFVLLFFLYFRHSQGGAGGGGKIFNVGRSKARFFSPNSINVTFKDVAGVEEVKEDLLDIIDFLKSPERFTRIGAKIPRGILLTGAPGNGKTLLAKAVAGEAHCPFFSISGSDFVEVFVGVGASRVRDLFKQARQNSPCIVFIDEIDAVGRQRGIGMGGGNDEREQTLNQLLAEMDGFTTEAGSVIVLAATNRPDVLDKALLRPGRFDRTIEVPFPDLICRTQILNVHARKVKLHDQVDLEKIARGTAGFSGADLENLINEAALLASKEHETTVQMRHFEVARDKIMLGAERRTIKFTQEDKEMTAYHEAGHTMLTLLQQKTDPLHKVTIVPRGRALGVSWSLPERDKYSQTQSEMEARIVVCLGGLLAEQMIFNDQTSGVSNDLEKATKIARTMVSRYGMSALGPIEYNISSEHPYLGRDIQSGREFSESTMQRIDKEVEKIITMCYERGKKLLTENRDKLETLAKALLEKETLHAAEVYELLGIEPRQSHSFHDDDQSPSEEQGNDVDVPSDDEVQGQGSGAV